MRALEAACAVMVLLLCAGLATAQVRPPQPRTPPERGYGTAAERLRAAQAAEVRRARAERNAGGGGTSESNPGETERPAPVPEERAKEYLTAVERRLAAIKNQCFDFVASEPASVGVKWQVRGHYESSRAADGTLSERIDLSWSDKAGKPVEERMLFSTTTKGVVQAWNFTAASGVVEVKGDPLSRVFRGKVLFFDILPPDLCHMDLSHAGEVVRAGDKLALLAATPRHGRKEALRILCDRRNGAMKETAVREGERSVLTMTDVVSDLGGIYAPTLRRVRLPGEEPSLLIHYSGRKINGVADPARFRPADLGR
jgi:hypothetical protein